MININKHKLQKIASGVLIAFTLISLGYMLGKNSIRPETHHSGISSADNYIAVYYVHTTFRCETCNTIERMTKDLLYDKYGSALENDTIRWQEIDFMKNQDIAKQFGVSASCVVVARVDGGKVSEFKRLDEVWTRMKDPAAFNSYISDAIDGYLSLKEDL